MTIDLNDPVLRQKYNDHIAVAAAHNARPAKFAREYTEARRAAGEAIASSEVDRLRQDLANLQKLVAALQAQQAAAAPDPTKAKGA